MIAPASDHKRARELCSLFRRKNDDAAPLHKGDTTDLILGGGCGICNKFLGAMRDAREEERKEVRKQRPAMMTSHTRTFVIMKVEPSTYVEIRKKLLDAGYDFAVWEEGEHGTILDMHGIALGVK